jgi:hypothetical protein
MMGSMSTAARTSLRSTPIDHADTPAAEQLTLLSAPPTPARFRLSKDTRERGLRHVAEIRSMLAALAENAATDAASRAATARLERQR